MSDAPDLDEPSVAGRTRRRRLSARALITIAAAGLGVAVVLAIVAAVANSGNNAAGHPAATGSQTAEPGGGTSTQNPAPTPSSTIIYVTVGSGGSGALVDFAALGSGLAGVGAIASGVAAFVALRKRRDDQQPPVAAEGAGPEKLAPW